MNINAMRDMQRAGWRVQIIRKNMGVFTQQVLKRLLLITVKVASELHELSDECITLLLSGLRVRL